MKTSNTRYCVCLHNLTYILCHFREFDKIDDVIEEFSEIISHENTQYFLSSLPDFIVCSNILFGLNIIDDAEKIKITVDWPKDQKPHLDL